MDNIGEILKNTRLDKGLSLEQVEEATSIRKIYLAAIETGDYAKIPGDVFTKRSRISYALQSCLCRC